MNLGRLMDERKQAAEALVPSHMLPAKERTPYALIGRFDRHERGQLNLPERQV